MQIAKPAVLAFLLLTGACASSRAVERPLEESQEKSNEPFKGGVAEFRLTSYDGCYLRGRVLLGATADTLVIHKLLIEDRNVELEKIRACGTAELRGHVIADFLTGDEWDETVTLREGYWHGADLDYFLWEKKNPGPDCFDAELELNVVDGRVAATLPIRVVRTDKPPGPPDGGAAPPPKPLALDAGAR